MRRTLAVSALGLALLTTAACSKSTPETPGASPSVSVSASAGAVTPAPAGSVVTGSADVKTVCAVMTTKTTTWVMDFTEGGTELLKVGNDKAKIAAAVKKLKDATAKLAAEMRAEGAKASDAGLVRASANLAVALDKVNAKLTVEAATKDPTSPMEAFQSAELTGAVEAVRKICGN